jgi:hypothetical protein
MHPVNVPVVTADTIRSANTNAVMRILPNSYYLSNAENWRPFDTERKQFSTIVYNGIKRQDCLGEQNAG